MMQIFFTIALTVSSLFGLGYGITNLLIPEKLKKYSFWLIPWYAISTITVFLTIFSQIGITISNSGLFISIILLLMSAFYCFKNRCQNLNLKFFPDVILGIFIIFSIIFNLSPLFLKEHFLTTVTLGNNDPIAYAKTGDYLVNHSLKESKSKDTFFEIKDLLNGDYRFGPPMLNGYFLKFFNLRGYQFTYLFQVVLFALSIPLIYILFDFIYIKTFLGTILLLVLYSFNVNILYIIYHNFFGQILYWGISLLLLIYFYSIFTEKNNNSFLSKAEITIVILLTNLYFSYHEGVVFIIPPVIIAFLINFLLNKHKDGLISIIKIYLLTILVTKSSFVNNLFFSYKQFFLPIESNIGWQLFRDKNPFPNPIEMIGTYSIHFVNPLPIFFAYILSLIIILVIIYGLLKLKNNLFFFAFSLVYLFFYIKTGIIQPHFFHYYRIVTYTLPVILIIFTAGIHMLLKKFKLVFFLLCVVMISLEIAWALKLNYKFINTYLSVGKPYVSLLGLKNKFPKEYIYSENVLEPSIVKWNEIWIRYFLPENLNQKKIKDNDLILITKNPSRFNKVKYFLKTVIWENDYYILGRVCLSDNCLLNSNENFSELIPGKSEYEDSLFLSGWSNKEPENRWSNNKLSDIRLVSKKNDYFTSLVFEVLTLVKPQVVTVYIDDKRIGSQILDTVWKQYQLFFNERLEIGVHRVAFKFSDIYQPNKYFTTEDNRYLTVNFREIKLK